MLSLSGDCLFVFLFQLNVALFVLYGNKNYSYRLLLNNNRNAKDRDIFDWNESRQAMIDQKEIILTNQRRNENKTGLNEEKKNGSKMALERNWKRNNLI